MTPPDDVSTRLAEIRERYERYDVKGPIRSEMEMYWLVDSDVPCLLSLVEEVGEALAEMPPKEVDALLDLTEMRCSEEHAETLAQVRDAALKRKYDAALRDAAQEGAE